jgi:hypothetical protein
MSHVHARDHLGAGTTVRVDCDHQCNVLVMDDQNYARYRRGDDYRAHGGFFRQLPVGIRVPHSGYWNTVIDLAGGQARIRHSINYIG